MRRTLLAAGILFSFGTGAQAQQKYDLFQLKISDRAELVLEALQEATKAVEGVRDAKSAEVAKAVLESVGKRIKQYSERTTERTPEERRWVADVFEPKRDAELEKLNKAYDAVLARDVQLLPLFLDTKTLDVYRGKTIGRARLMAQNIQRACKAYRITLDDRWPVKLEDLVPGPEKRNYLEGGKAAITTPWGKPFQYRLEKDAEGEEFPVISAVSPFGDGKQEIRWPEKGK